MFLGSSLLNIDKKLKDGRPQQFPSKSTDSTTSSGVRAQVVGRVGTVETQVDTDGGVGDVAASYPLLARTSPSALFIASPSCFANVPSLRTIRALSRVKSLKRTLQGTLRPACRQL